MTIVNFTVARQDCLLLSCRVSRSLGGDRICRDDANISFLPHITLLSRSDLVSHQQDIQLPVALESDEEDDPDNPRSSINGNIGHFGVGAKHAVFYLGDCEHIVTCARQAGGRKIAKPVLELVSH